MSQAPLCSPRLPLLLPHMIALWPGHRVLKRESICLSAGNATSVLVGGCKYNIISRSLCLLPEIIHIYTYKNKRRCSAGGGGHCLAAPWPLEIPTVARKIDFHLLEVTAESLCNPSWQCQQPSSLPHGEEQSTGPNLQLIKIVRTSF